MNKIRVAKWRDDSKCISHLYEWSRIPRLSIEFLTDELPIGILHPPIDIFFLSFKLMI
jgi:hypothetical protein